MRSPSLYYSPYSPASEASCLDLMCCHVMLIRCGASFRRATTVGTVHIMSRHVSLHDIE